MNATLSRTKMGDSGTFGLLRMADGTTYVTGELPWRDNRPQMSCIPPGLYLCSIYSSPAHGDVFQVRAVPGRDYIEIHPANWFGDHTMGLRCDMLGCIGLGTNLTTLAGQDAIGGSRIAIAQFMAKQQGQPFELLIIDDTPDHTAGADFAATQGAPA